MSETEYLKCDCKECGNHIEFPVEAARTTITCPHCGQWTELLVVEDEAEKTGGVRIKLVPLLVGIVLLVAGIGAIWFWQHKQPAVDAKADGQLPVKIAAPAKKPALPPTNQITEVAAPPVKTVTPKALKPKSADDLKVGAIQLEKTKGSSLVYAVGMVKNDSEFDRYGVHIELDLINAKGKKIGTAKDYKDYLGPNQEWQFRALIPDPKTIAAKVATVKED